MKKKLLALGLILIIAFSVTACGGDGGSDTDADGKTAYQLLEDANAALEEAGSYAMGMDINMAMEAAGETMDMIMTGHVKQVTDGDDVIMETTVSTSMLGQAMEVTGYYTDGYYYTDVSGQKIKTPMSLDEVMSQSSGMSMDFEETAITDQKINGNNLEFTISKDALTDIVGPQLEGLLGSGDSMDLSDIKLVVELSDGVLKTMTMQFSMTGSVQGQDLSVDYDAKMDVTSVGNVTVDLPADLDTYTEVDPSTLQ